ncbi:MAG: hypothetical protein ACI4EU_10930 [Butyrivibrio sp.]
MGATKTTNGTEWNVYTVAKTMISNPKVKLVNSNGECRSDIIRVGEARKTSKGNSNTGMIGFAEYLAIKPAVNQCGTDTIKLQMKNN